MLEHYIAECFFCGHIWGECTCHWHGGDCGFDFQGTFITEPNVDETGRFFVVPVTYYGDAYKKWAAHL